MAIKYYSSVTDKFYDTIDKAKADEDAANRSDKIKEVVKQIEDVELSRQHEVAVETRKINEIDEQIKLLVRNKETAKENIRHINEEADREIQELKSTIRPCNNECCVDDDEDDTDEDDEEDDSAAEERMKYYQDMINTMGKVTSRFNSTLKDLLKYYDI